MSDTDDSAQTSPRPFAWDRLPEELQLELLFNLDYYELKEVQAVSKNFREFVKSKQFDKPLFREAPRPGLLTKRMRIELHPLLDGVDFFSSSQTSACYRTMNYESNAFEYAAVKEYATSPACSRMSFRFNHRDFEDVDDPGILAVKSGITVKDVLDFLIAFWEKEIQAGWSRDWLYEKGGTASVRPNSPARRRSRLSCSNLVLTIPETPSSVRSLAAASRHSTTCTGHLLLHQ
ncbi:hypothetical protein JCM10020v2_005059 [Rhodotorula toruloides]